MAAGTQTLMPAGAPDDRQACPRGTPNGNKMKSHILPYGSTLHYAGCGCPAWQKGSRVADQVDALVARSHQLFRNKLISPNRPLRVCYMLPHHNITGGMKCLVEHIRLLRQRGHYTIAVHRSDTAKHAMPPWTTVEADVDVVCNLHQRLSDVYPIHDIDVVVVGIFHQVAELLAGVPAPVLYWEQGHEWVFGDPIRLQAAQNYLKQDQLFHLVMHLPCVLAAVSGAVQDILQQEFGRTSLLIPNGIDCDRFTPGAWQPAGAAAAAVVVQEDTAAAAAAAGLCGVADHTAAASAANDCSIDASGTALQKQQQLHQAAAGNSAQPLVAADVDGVVTGSGEAAGTAVAQAMPAARAAAVSAAAPSGEVDALAEQHQATAATVMQAATPAQHCPQLSARAEVQQQQQPSDPVAVHGANPLADPDDGSTATGQSSGINVKTDSHPEAAAAAAPPDGKHRILIVGNPALPLKGFPTAIAALAAVAAMLPIRVRWVCQVPPTSLTVPNLPLVDFELETVVSPSQAELPALYRGHDAFLFTSRYEAWGMPVLEAMASAVPVVTTDCLGVRTFCRHGENCMLAPADDAAGVAQHLLAVLTDPVLKARLAAAGRATALQYTPDQVLDHLEAILYCLTACGSELLQLRQTCLADLHVACTKASEACSRSSSAAQQQQQQQLMLLQARLQQQLQQQAAAKQRLQALLQQQQQLQVGLQLTPVLQQQGQPVRLQSLQVLQQMNLANPQQLLRQHQQPVPLQASLLMPFLQSQQPSLQPTLQLQQTRSSGPPLQQQPDYSSMNAAVVGEVLKLTSQQQQTQQQHSILGVPVLQQQAPPAAVLQQFDVLKSQGQQQQQNAAALQVLQQLQQDQQQTQQQQQQAALLSILQGGSSSGQLPPSSLMQQQVPGPLLLQQQQAHIATSLFQQQHQQQVSMSLWQQQQQVPTSLFLQQQQQQHAPLLNGFVDGTSAAAADGTGLPLQSWSQQLLLQGIPLGVQQQQQQHQVLHRLSQQQMLQNSTQSTYSQQLPSGFLQQQQQQQQALGFGQPQQQLELLPLVHSMQMQAGLAQQLGMSQHHHQQQQDLGLPQQLFRS